jgi:hypothetical protein
MAQAVDGNWYGYFADRKQASIADSTSDLTVAAGTIGVGLDFGSFCGRDGATEYAGISFTDTVGVAFPAQLSNGVNGTASGSAIADSACANGNVAITNDASVSNGTAVMNVLREAKDINPGPNTNVPVGQLSGLNSTASATTDNGIWPFIQLYALNPTGNVIVQYNKGGGAQSTTLTFDTVDQFAGATLDSAKYTTSAQVHVTVTDLWLNIDPTDEDSWTWTTLGTNNTGYYQLFDENGGIAGDGQITTANDIVAVAGVLMCEDNCVLKLNTDAQGTGSAVVTLNDNDDTVLFDGSAVTAGETARTQSLSTASQPLTITEQGPNSGVFGTYDESDISVVQVSSTASRGTSASIDYNETPATILIGFDFATIDILPTIPDIINYSMKTALSLVMVQ